MSAIIANNISKKFRIPHQKKKTLLQHTISLFKRRTTYEEFWALKNVSFEVGNGESFGIIGSNGSGKSTLLKILAKVMYPDGGTMTANGKTASFLELGAGFQPELTAAENIYIYSSILGLSRRETNKIYDSILEFAELKRFEDMKLKNFSSGMFMRLAFSTAVHTDPEIMLIDEVLAVGDEAFQKKSMNKIKELQKQGKTIVLVTHSLQTVIEMCDKAILLDKGLVVSQGDTEDVVDNYLALLASSGNAPLSVSPVKSAPNSRDTIDNLRLLGANRDTSIFALNSPDYFILSNYKAERTGIMHNMQIRCASQGNVKVAVYADNNGEPGKLLNSIDASVHVNMGWNVIPFPPTAIIAEKEYWLAFCTDKQIAGVKSETNFKKRYRPADFSSFKFPNPAGSDFIVSTEYSDIISGWTNGIC